MRPSPLQLQRSRMVTATRPLSRHHAATSSLFVVNVALPCRSSAREASSRPLACSRLASHKSNDDVPIINPDVLPPPPSGSQYQSEFQSNQFRGGGGPGRGGRGGNGKRRTRSSGNDPDDGASPTHVLVSNSLNFSRLVTVLQIDSGFLESPVARQQQCNRFSVTAGIDTDISASLSP